MNEKELYFIAFANKSYMTTDRIANQAKEMNVFDKILQLTEDDISEYVEKHSNFIKSNPYGYGLFIWKPKVIYDTLLKMNNEDILVYCDAGTYVNKKGKDRFEFYIEQLNKHDMVVFSTSDNYKAQRYVKNDAIMAYYPEFNKEWTTACYAGLMIIKKTQKSLELIKDWLELCENYHFLDKSNIGKHKNLPHYIGNDCDNGLFNLCLAKYKIHFVVTPDEVNIYAGGTQIAHTGKNQKEVDWSSLDHIPFQIRRMTPKFGF
jgi:hypothetical protein